MREFTKYLMKCRYAHEAAPPLLTIANMVEKDYPEISKEIREEIKNYHYHFISAPYYIEGWSFHIDEVEDNSPFKRPGLTRTIVYERDPAEVNHYYFPPGDADIDINTLDPNNKEDTFRNAIFLLAYLTEEISMELIKDIFEYCMDDLEKIPPEKSWKYGDPIPDEEV